jgi:hypothetical protein
MKTGLDRHFPTGNQIYMKRNLMFKLALTFLASGAIAFAGQLITFDDLATSSYMPITNGYAGFNWTNVWVANSVYLGDGYLSGTVSSPNVAFNGFGADASFSVASGTFTLTSAYITSVNGANITVKGYNSSTLVYNKAYPVNDAGPSLVTFDYNDITEVYITGGKFAIDNMTINGTVPVGGLTITLSGANVVLTWPTNATSLTLQSTTNLVSPVVWAGVSPAPGVANGQNTVTNAFSGTQQYFRLRQ